MSKLRKNAKGKSCSLRLNCSIPETVVLAHIGRNRGMGIKCADYMAVFACSSCHDIIDGRVKSEFSKLELEAEKLRALEETLGQQVEDGLICM